MRWDTGQDYAEAARRATTLRQAYKEARNSIRHQAGIEKAVVTSASVLWTNVDDGKKMMAVLKARETAGSIKLTPVPPPTPVKKKK